MMGKRLSKAQSAEHTDKAIEEHKVNKRPKEDVSDDELETKARPSYSRKWQQLTPLKYKGVTHAARINQHEFAVATDVGFASDGAGGIFTYNTLNNTWSRLLEYPQSYSNSNTSACCDIDQQTLYIVGGRAYGVVAVDLNERILRSKHSSNKIGPFPAPLVINQQLNVSGGEHSKSHYQWHADQTNFVQNYEFNTWKQCSTCNGVVYLKSKQCVLLFGGYDFGRSAPDLRLNEIWKWKMAENEWQRLSVTLPYNMDSFGWVLSNDERYVIIFGGAADRAAGWRDEILLWNVQTMVISKSRYKCPESGLFNAVIMPNDEIHLHRVFDGIGHWKMNARNIVMDDTWIVDGYLRTAVSMSLPNEIRDLIFLHYLKLADAVLSE